MIPANTLATPEGESGAPASAELPADARPALAVWAPLILTAIYLTCILAVNPSGEFPLNDDWSYSRSAFVFARENRMQVDEFSAPSLVGQALYGGWLIKIFGARFIVLRLATLILSLGTSLLIWITLRRLNVSSGIAWIAALSWIFNPIQFCLAFSFMTEVHFLFFVALAVLCFVLFAERQETRYLIACGAALGYACLIRQTAILFISAALLALLLEKGRTKLPGRLKRALMLGAISASFVAAYWLWTQAHGGATPASGRKFELLRQLTVAQLAGNSFGVMFYLSFMLLPLWIHLTPRLIHLWNQNKSGNKAASLFAWTSISFIGLWWFHSQYSDVPNLPSRAFHSQMPFLLNVLYDTGLGPLTLDPTYYGPAPTPVYPNLWFGVTLLTALGAVMAGMWSSLSMTGAIEKGACAGRMLLSSMSLLSVIAVAAFEVIFSHTQEGGLFDRHLLIAAFPLTLYACLKADRAAAPPPLRLASSFSAAATAMLALFAWFSIAGTHDYLAWNRVRWELGDEALRQNVNPLLLSGGFEFNGWHNYDTFKARGNVGKIFYWWYDDPIYVISMESQEGYRILERREYYSWLHLSSLPLYLSKREASP